MGKWFCSFFDVFLTLDLFLGTVLENAKHKRVATGNSLNVPKCTFSGPQLSRRGLVWYLLNSSKAHARAGLIKTALFIAFILLSLVKTFLDTIYFNFKQHQCRIFLYFQKTVTTVLTIHLARQPTHELVCCVLDCFADKAEKITTNSKKKSF